MSAGSPAISLVWTAPTSSGGLPITDYRYTTDNTTYRSLATTDTSAIISQNSAGTALANGTQYTIQIVAVNTIGNSALSNSIITTIPTTAPTPPTLTSATGGNQSIGLVWTVPTSNGGYPITDYQYSTDNGANYRTLATTGTSATIILNSAGTAQLVNGTQYIVSIVAVNTIGRSSISNFLMATPVTLSPTAPTLTSATGGNQLIDLVWTVPTSTGGSPITSYQYSTNGSSYYQLVLKTATTATITTTSTSPYPSLTNGTPYPITIKAVNAVGPSPASNSITATPDLTPPSAPTLSSATGGNQSIALVWTVPTFTGNSPITGYLYSTNGSSYYQLVLTTATTATITTTSTSPYPSLTNGTPYPITIKAVNAVGPGPASNSIIATPATAPSAPNLTSATAGNQSIALVWTAPVSTGGSSITDYQYSTDGSTYKSIGQITPTSATITTLSSSSEILVNGTPYPITIRAVNVVAPSVASNSITVTPATVPTAPTLTSATGRNQGIMLVWTAPTSTGGSPITDYQYSTDSGLNYKSLATTDPFATITTTSTNPYPSLVNGTPYTVIIRAVNAVNPSAASAPLTATPFLPPMVIQFSIPSGRTLRPALTFTVGQSVNIDWGDGNTGTYSSLPQHVYGAGGTYSMTVTGTANGFNGMDSANILSVSAFLDSLTDLSNLFKNQASNFTVPTYLPVAVTNMSNMFDSASLFNQPINSWSTATVTNMTYMFNGALAFNRPINSWKTAAVTNMAHMFHGAAVFNQPLSSWNTGAVTDMSYMFVSTAAFNQDISSWNTAAVTNMGNMFQSAGAFNQPINSWITSSVTNMTSMFQSATAFNKSLNSWNTTKVTSMAYMFYNAANFNGDIYSWNTTAVTTMFNMLSGANVFNQDLSLWSVTGLTNANAAKSIFARGTPIASTKASWPNFASNPALVGKPDSWYTT